MRKEKEPKEYRTPAGCMLSSIVYFLVKNNSFKILAVSSGEVTVCPMVRESEKIS